MTTPMSTPMSAISSSHGVSHFGWQTPSSAPHLATFAMGGGLSSSAGSVATPSTSTSGWKSTLTLQQLSGFGMRNLSAHGTASGALMDVYFKLVLDRQVVYVSEIVRNTLNPVWVPFQTDDTAFGEGNIRQLFSGTYFDIIVVRVNDRRRPRRKSRALSGRLVEDDAWEPNTRPLSEQPSAESGDDEDEMKASVPVADAAVAACIEEEEILGMSFNVRELEPLPVSVAEITNLPLNTCLFEFNGRTYVRREVTEVLIESGVISAKHSRRKGSAIQLKEYSLHEGVESLQRIISTKQEIEQRTVGNDALKKQIEQQLCAAKPVVSKEQRRTAMEDRVRALRKQVTEKKANLERLKTVMHDERKTFETDIHIPKALLSTMQMSMRYKDEKQGILERRCEVLRAAHKIRSRQAMLVKQLGAVYPIDYEGAGEYKIRGIKITSSDLTVGGRADEETISTALGYIAHLVFMLSKYLHVNLRYRVVPYSSRSYLKDEINDPHGEYPLYKKGADRERFERGIHYLRKDVEQLLFSRGLDPTHGAPILARLKALTDAEISWLLSDRDFNTSNGSSSVSNGAIVPR